MATSALMQAPMIKSILPPGKQVGILTISMSTLTDDHLLAAGVPLDTPIAGTDGGREFTEKLLGDCLEVDFDLCREDMRDAALELVADNENLGAILLECTNMVPYAEDIRRLTGTAGLFDLHFGRLAASGFHAQTVSLRAKGSSQKFITAGLQTSWFLRF